MNKDNTIIKKLAVKLRRLLEQEQDLSTDIKAWDKAVETFRSELTTEEINLIPHFVWHYLADADIRAKDKSYKEQQEKEIEIVIKEMESGKLQHMS